MILKQKTKMYYILNNNEREDDWDLNKINTKVQSHPVMFVTSFFIERSISSDTSLPFMMIKLTSIYRNQMAGLERYSIYYNW